MRETCRVGSRALARTMARSRELQTEGQVLASVEFEAKMSGACHLAYPPVVAAGNNATVIHYIAATSQLDLAESVLVDAGCEYHGYTSDITRTWPGVSDIIVTMGALCDDVVTNALQSQDGAWTERQRELYEVVLTTQAELIASIRPGVTSVDSLYKDMQVGGQ